MTQPTQVEQSSKLDDGDDNLVHIWCCDKFTAMCGVDITNATPTDSDENECVVCVYLADELPCQKCGELP